MNDKTIERLAIALDYIRVTPINMMAAWDGRGKDTLRDRDMVWNLDSGHTFHIPEYRKDDFRDAARKLLEETGLTDLVTQRDALVEAAKAMLETHTINDEATLPSYKPGWLKARQATVAAIAMTEPTP